MAGREAASRLRWEVIRRTQSGDHSLASWAFTWPIEACRCLSRETENQPRTGCQWQRLLCLAVTYWEQADRR